MDLVSQLLANFNQSIEADISKHMEFKLEVWTCNPIQEADKEAWKTTPHTQFELDSPPALILRKESLPRLLFQRIQPQLQNGFEP